MGIEWVEDAGEGHWSGQLGLTTGMCVCECVSVSVVCTDGKLSLFRVVTSIFTMFRPCTMYRYVFSISQHIVHN